MKTIGIALRMILFMTVLTGIAYPLLVTGVAQLLFPSEANGSIVHKNITAIGSRLIGQSFDASAIYFHSRPSAVSYNPLPSGGSNYGLTNKALVTEFRIRGRQFRSENLEDEQLPVPSEMLFASASGLDPDISPEAALLQVDRVSTARHFTNAQKTELVEIIRQLTQSPQFLFLGEKRINVFMLNLRTDSIR